MELKIRDEYSYFIHTFIVKEDKYVKYLNKLLRDERFRLKILNKEIDKDLYFHFLPKIRSFLFRGFDLDEDKLLKFQKLPIDTKAALLAEFPCVIFEYNMEEDIQGKAGNDSDIFFKVQKVQIILFNTGIGFLCIKTTMENSNSFSDLLDFNNKLRNVKDKSNDNEKLEEINIQASSLGDMVGLKDFVKEITGPDLDALKKALDIEQFYTYSYACVSKPNDDLTWKFENTKEEFKKFINVFPSKYNYDLLQNKDIEIMELGKYSKIGISKLGMKLLCSDEDMENYTLVPYDFERKYFYTYILMLYFRVYLKKIDYEFKNSNNIVKVRKKFVYFTKNLKIQEITTEDMGSDIYNTIKKTLEIEGIYADVKNKYDVLYKESKIERNEKVYTRIIGILAITLLFNLVNIILMFFGK